MIGLSEGYRRDRGVDESGHQVAAAAALGLPLTRVRVGAGEIAAAFPRTVALAERPTLRTAPTPLLLLSAAVRAHGLKVVLTGEGADELLGGYEIFQEAKVRRFWSRDPESRLRPLLLRRLYPYLARDLASTGEFLARAFGRGLDRPDDPLFSHLVRLSNGERLHGLFDEGFLERARADGGPADRLRRTLPRDFDGLTPLARAQLIEITTFLQGYLLHVQGDRMLMGNSVEGRFPYLDHRVAELAARVPDALLLRGLDEKELLRRAARKRVPHGLAERRKRPYRAPIAAALAGPSSPEWLVDLLQPRRLAETAVFEPEAVGRLLRKSRSGALLSELEEMALAGVVSTLLLHEQLVANPERREAVVPDRVVVDGVVVGEGGAVAAASGGA
jgi:asparagine synthase (glutamine-hydrolysing)